MHQINRGILLHFQKDRLLALVIEDNRQALVLVSFYQKQGYWQKFKYLHDRI